MARTKVFRVMYIKLKKVKNLINDCSSFVEMNLVDLEFLLIELGDSERSINVDTNWTMKLRKSKLKALCKSSCIKG